MSKYLNIVDLASRTGNDRILPVVELLAQNNPIIADMAQVECNDKTGYKTVVRTGLPSVAWRKLNYGVPQSKSETQQVRDACGMLEGWSYSDADLVNLAKDKAEFLKSECDGFLEQMSQTWAKTIFYGDTTKEPEKFNGLAIRYNALSGKNPSVKNVISAGSTKNANTSIYLVGWGTDKVHGIYPEGSAVGIVHEDDGIQRVEDENGNPYKAYVNHFKVNAGLTVRDWRYAVRICNIDPSDIDASALLQLMVKAKRLIPNLNACNPVFYAPREVVTALEIAYMDKANVTLTLQDAQSGLKELRASGIPVHTCDAIQLDEPKVA